MLLKAEFLGLAENEYAYVRVFRSTDERTLVAVHGESAHGLLDDGRDNENSPWKYRSLRANWNLQPRTTEQTHAEVSH